MSIQIADFLEATREARMVTRNRLKNEATKRNYFFQSRMWRTQRENIKGGKTIKTHVQGIAHTGGGWYNPKNSFNLVRNDTLTPIEAPWAFLHNGYPLIDETEELNAGDAEAFVDYVMAEEQACLTKMVNDAEASLWATPNYDLMEGTLEDEDARHPYSLLSLITRDGLVPSSSNGGIATGSSAWTALQTVTDIANKEWFQNQSGTYDASDPFDLTGGIVAMLDEQFILVHYEYPDLLAKNGNETDNQDNLVICTNLDGVTLYMAALRALNDRMASISDPAIRGPNYHGVPVKEVAELTANAGWTSGQPDYIGADLGEVTPFYRADRFFKEKITQPTHDHPNKMGVWKFAAMNHILHSRRRFFRGYAA